VSYFHGQISAGKSSIARLVDFCLGGKLERTPAIGQELVSVQLSAIIEDQEVLFEREAKDSNQIQVTWRPPEGPSGSVLAPITASPTRGPIWGNEIYNLSDLIFHLFGFPPIKVRKSEIAADSKLVRLSFRDIMWYCYLEQGELDSSFFNLEKPIIMTKSRHAIRFIVGAYTEKLNELELELSRIRELRVKKKNSIEQLRTFLEPFGYSSDQEIISEIEQINSDLINVRSELMPIRDGYTKDTHFADELRDQLRQLNEQLLNEKRVLVDLNKRIEEQKSLKGELLTAKFKLARSKSAKVVLADLPFKYCPSCGAKVDHRRDLSSGVCLLCGQHPPETDDRPLMEEEVVRRDLDLRIKELDESLERHKKARIAQELDLSRLKEEKALLDEKLDEELKNYDSRFLARSREIERKIASYEERIRGLKRILKMPEAVTKIEKEVDMLGVDLEGLGRRCDKERESIEASGRFVREIEDAFLQALLAVGVPGVSENDTVRVNAKTWVPDILIGGDISNRWNFYNAGSAGKKTLLNVCYALAVHKVSSVHKLPLPTLLIIDTPMKNIGEDVNRDIFEAFYTYLYKLAQGPLSNTQFIIIDKEYFAPESKIIGIKERYMTVEDDECPPLISYYRGP
jgi:hypothetical protein